MTAGVRIQPAAPDDVGRLAAVQLETILQARAGILQAGQAPPTLEQLEVDWATAVADPGTDVLAASVPDGAGWRLIGAVRLGRDPDRQGEAELSRLHVDPAWRGRGVGARIESAAVAALVERGWPAASAWVMRDDRRARSFFERQGWAPVAGHAVDRGDGLWEFRYRRQLSWRHPSHDEVAREVRGWFTAPVPEIGLDVERHEYGFLTRPGSPVGPRLVLTVDDPARVASALSMAGVRQGTGDFEVWVDDRGRAARVHEALVASGCRPVEDTKFLGLVGPIAAHPGPSELTVEEVSGEAALLTWSATKLQASADSEALPAPAALAAETARRGAETPVARYELARLDGVPVAVLACYTGSDQLVFNLGIRVPHRHRGIGQALLGRWASRGVNDGCRSLMINAEDGGARRRSLPADGVRGRGPLVPALSQRRADERHRGG